RTHGAMNTAQRVAYLDNRARLQTPIPGPAPTNPPAANAGRPSGNRPQPTKFQNLQGTWKPTGGGAYTLTFTEGKRSLEVPARLENNKLAVTKDNARLLFEK